MRRPIIFVLLVGFAALAAALVDWFVLHEAGLVYSAPKRREHGMNVSLGTWRLIQAPLKPCVGPSDREFWGYFNRTAQCPDLAAPLSKWCRVSIGRGNGANWWNVPPKRSTFDSGVECLVAIYGRDPWPAHGPYICIRADDPRLAAQKPCTCIYEFDDDLSHCFPRLNGK